MKHTHRCAADGCNVVIPNKLLMCLPHWKRVSHQTQALVYAGYRNMQAGASVFAWVQAVEKAKQEAAA